tara:strand:- start:81 stop:1409 length:1329 start_codon:yes stop_codon:yes gene_type:complete
MLISFNAAHSYEIKDLDKKSLNSKFPKPVLEDGWGDRNYSTTFDAPSCYNSSKSKKTYTLEGNHTFDAYVACRITSPLGYHKHLRVHSDSYARNYCETKYQSLAFYRGLSKASDLTGKAFRLTGDVISLGLYANKRTVGISYVCDDIKNKQMVINKEINNFKLSSSSKEKVCYMLLSDDGLGWLPVKKHLENQANNRIDQFSLDLKKCRKITGRLTKKEIAAETLERLKKDNEKKRIAEELKAAKEKDELEKKLKEIKRLSELSDLDLCKETVSLDGNFYNAASNQLEFGEIGKRNLTLTRCQNLTDRYTPEIKSRMLKTKECKALGFKEETPEIGNCILKLMEFEAIAKGVEISKKNKEDELVKKKKEAEELIEIEKEKLALEKAKLQQLRKQAAIAEEEALQAKRQADALKAKNRTDSYNRAMDSLKGLSCYYGNTWDCY